MCSEDYLSSIIIRACFKFFKQSFQGSRMKSGFGLFEYECLLRRCLIKSKEVRQKSTESFRFLPNVKGQRVLTCL